MHADTRAARRLDDSILASPRLEALAALVAGRSK